MLRNWSGHSIIGPSRKPRARNDVCLLSAAEKAAYFLYHHSCRAYCASVNSNFQSNPVTPSLRLTFARRRRTWS